MLERKWQPQAETRSTPGFRRSQSESGLQLGWEANHGKTKRQRKWELHLQRLRQGVPITSRPAPAQQKLRQDCRNVFSEGFEGRDRDSRPKGGATNMRKTILMLTCLALCAGTVASAASVSEQLVKSTNVLNEIMGAPDNGIPSDLLDKAVCVGIVPSELKFAIGVGGSYGRGVLVCRKGGTGAWGAPSLFTLGGGSFGFQLGGKATDVVFIVMNARGASKLVQDNVKLGAELSAAAGPVGRSGEGATDAQMRAEILSYSRTRGLFAGASLDGAVVKQDKDDNEKVYGRRVTAQEILFGAAVSSPGIARGLDRALDKYSPRGGQPFEAGTAR